MIGGRERGRPGWDRWFRAALGVFGHGSAVVDPGELAVLQPVNSSPQLFVLPLFGLVGVGLGEGSAMQDSIIHEVSSIVRWYVRLSEERLRGCQVSSDIHRYSGTGLLHSN